MLHRTSEKCLFCFVISMAGDPRETAYFDRYFETGMNKFIYI